MSTYYVTSPAWARRLRTFCEAISRWTRRFDKHYLADPSGAVDYSRPVTPRFKW